MAENDKEERDADEVIREYYESQDTSDADADEEVKEEFREAQAQRGAETRRGAIEDYEPGAMATAGGDVDARWDREDVGDETVSGQHAMPDQDIVEEVGEAVGLTFQDTEPLGAAAKIEQRDNERWELNPASSEDYQERVREETGAQNSEERRRQKRAG